MFCSNCGNKLPDIAKFCNKCGFKIAINAVAPTATPISQPVEPKERFVEPVVENIEPVIPTVDSIVPESNESAITDFVEVKPIEEVAPIVEEVEATKEDSILKTSNFTEEPIVKAEETVNEIVNEEPTVIFPDTPEDQIDFTVKDEAIAPESSFVIPEELPQEDISAAAEAPVINETPVYDTPQEQIFPETPVYGMPSEPVDSQPNVYAFGGPAQANNNAQAASGYQQQQFYQEPTYHTAEPVKNASKPKRVKTKKRRPLAVAIICGFFTFIFTIVLFVAITLLFARVNYGKMTTTNSKKSVVSNVAIGELPVGSLINNMGDEDDIDDDMTVSEYIYDKLGKKDQKKTSPEEISELIDESGVIKLLGTTVSNYANVAVGQNSKTNISIDDILDAIEEDEELISGVIGRDLTKSDYNNIEKRLEELNIEKKTTFKSGLKDSSVPEPVISVLGSIVGDDTTAYTTLGIFIAIIVIILILLNLHKPYVVLLQGGTSTLSVGAIGIVASLTIGTIGSAVASNYKAAGDLIKAILSGFKSSLLNTSIIFAAVGAGLIIAYVVINITVSVARKNR